MSLRANRDGGLETMEVKGMMQLTVTDAAYGCVRVGLVKRVEKDVLFQVCACVCMCACVYVGWVRDVAVRLRVYL